MNHIVLIHVKMVVLLSIRNPVFNKKWPLNSSVADYEYGFRHII